MNINTKLKQCTICSKTFNSYPSLSRHRLKIHQIEPKKLFVCPLCKDNAKNRYFFREHLKQNHGIKLKEERFLFNIFQGLCMFLIFYRLTCFWYTDFLDWKDSMERSTKSYFIRSRRISALNRYDEYYNCNRTGHNQISLEAQSISQRKSTSKKIGGLCPARINLNFDSKKNVITVLYCSTHVGHELDDTNHTARANNKKKSMKSLEFVEADDNGKNEQKIFKVFPNPNDTFGGNNILQSCSKSLQLSDKISNKSYLYKLDSIYRAILYKANDRTINYLLNTFQKINGTLETLEYHDSFCYPNSSKN